MSETAVQWRAKLIESLKARSLVVQTLLDGPRSFRILLAGSSVSMLGSRISTIAFPMLVLHLNDSPFVAGLVTFVAIVPSMIAYIPAGALVDRWDPWRVMLLSELMRGIAVASVVTCLLLFNGRFDIYLPISFMIVEEILEIFWMLADRRYMSQLTELDMIAPSQASIEVRAHAAVLAGRPIGPFLFTLTPFLPFLADAASFVVSIWTLLLLREPKARLKRLRAKHPLKPGRRLLDEIGEGFRWLSRNWHAGLTMLLMSFTTLIAQALIMMILAEAHDKRLSTVAIGGVLAASGAGGTIGSVVAGRLPDWLKKFWLQIQLCAWSLALGLLALSGVRLAWCIAAVMLFLGLTGSIGNIEFGAYLVRNVDDGMLGRIVSIGQVMTIGAFGLGPCLGGGAIQKFGIQVAVELFFILVLLIAIVSLSMPWISHLVSRRATVIPSPPMAEAQEIGPAMAWPEASELLPFAARPPEKNPSLAILTVNDQQQIPATCQ
jgi:MFS family permease